jgi:hypothetical protein
MANQVKIAYETAKPRQEVRESKGILIPHIGALSVRDNRTVFLSKAVIVKEGERDPILFSQETFEKVQAILEADAAAQGGKLEYKPETPIMRAFVRTRSGRPVTTNYFLDRMIGLAEENGLPMQEQGQNGSGAIAEPRVDQSVVSDKTPF